jgi:hypothetical protein
MTKKYLQAQTANSTQKNRDSKTDKREIRSTESSILSLPLVFSFKYFDKNQIPPGQDFKDWACDCITDEFIQNSENLVNSLGEKLQHEEAELHTIVYEEFQKNILQEMSIFSENSPPQKTLLGELCEKLKNLSELSIGEATRQNLIQIYGNFPPDEKTVFQIPRFSIPADAKWGTIQNVGGQKSRAAGFLVDNIFYIVFLDRDHVFWKSELKHT